MLLYVTGKDLGGLFQLWVQFEGKAWPVGGLQSLDDCRAVAERAGKNIVIGAPGVPWAY